MILTKNKYLIAGLIVLIALLITSATSGCISRTFSGGEKATAGTANEAPNDQNNVANSPTVSVRVEKLGESTSLKSSYGTPTAPATGNKFVKYAIYCTNLNANNLQMGNPNFLKLRDTGGNIYSYDSFTYGLQEQVNGVTLKGLSAELNTLPGDKLSGLIVFQVPQSAVVKSLTYDDYANRIVINL